LCQRFVVDDVRAVSDGIRRNVVGKLDGANSDNIPANGGVAWHGRIPKALHWSRHITFGAVPVLSDEKPAWREIAKHMLAG
jgi:hypothetical protein